jgi:xanthine/CO dehydrogenase XdhC/CoxF family maturation factor
MEHTDNGRSSSEEFMRAQAEVMKALHNDLVSGSDEALRKVMSQKGPVSDDSLRQARHMLPWKNFWDFYVIHRANPEVVSEQDLDEAAALCRAAYGDGFEVAMQRTLEGFAQPEADFNQVVYKNLPSSSIYLEDDSTP